MNGQAPPMQTLFIHGGGATHFPFLQVSPAGQTLPHPPQLLTSCSVSMHTCSWTPPQQVKLQHLGPDGVLQTSDPGGQHTPLIQMPDAHTVPHTPQLLGSFFVSTHLP